MSALNSSLIVIGVGLFCFHQDGLVNVGLRPTLSAVPLEGALVHVAYDTTLVNLPPASLDAVRRLVNAKVGQSPCQWGAWNAGEGHSMGTYCHGAGMLMLRLVAVLSQACAHLQRPVSLLRRTAVWP